MVEGVTSPAMGVCRVMRRMPPTRREPRVGGSEAGQRASTVYGTVMTLPSARRN